MTGRPAPPARRPPGAVGRRLSRLPLRVRLVTGFVAAMVVVLSVAGAFVYWRVSYALDLRLNNDLRAEAAALSPLLTGQGVLRDDPGLDRTSSGHQYQVLDGAGRVLSMGGDVRGTTLLSHARAAAAVHAEVVADIGPLLTVGRRPRHPLRVLATPLNGPGPAQVLVVAERRDGRDEALRELVGQLLLAGLGALVVTAVVGERLAKAALAPVERYRSQAAQIAAGATGVRLDVPREHDDEVTRLGHTLNEVLDALEHAVVRERQFTQDASHELHTPLTLLSTRVQLALRRPRSPAEHEATLREFGQDVAALSALAEELLKISTSEDSPSPNSEGCDLGAVSRALSAEYAKAEDSSAAGAPMKISFASCETVDPLPVQMPEEQARQVLGNLLGNAVLHGRGVVVVRVEGTDLTAVLTVTDSGPGIDASFLAAAADRFARADASRSRAGAGLGLSLVRALVERYDGELRLCSSGVHHRYERRFSIPCTHSESGTTATVLLPLK